MFQGGGMTKSSLEKVIMGGFDSNGCSRGVNIFIYNIYIYMLKWFLTGHDNSWTQESFTDLEKKWIVGDVVNLTPEMIRHITAQNSEHIVSSRQ